jgi:hypothetical protein
MVFLQSNQPFTDMQLNLLDCIDCRKLDSVPCVGSYENHFLSRILSTMISLTKLQNLLILGCSRKIRVIEHLDGFDSCQSLVSQLFGNFVEGTWK